MAIRISGDNTVASPAITSASDTDTGLQFGTNEVKVVNGNLDITDGNLIVASGHGIDFSATGDGSGTVTSELLDDYEEGSWTPVIVGRTTNGSTSNNRTAVGRYRKIGAVVHVMLDVDQTLSGAAGDFQINGLPFVAHSGPYVRFAGSVIFFNTFGTVTWSGSLVSYINDGGNFIWLRGNRSGTTSFDVGSGNGRREIAINMTYYVDS